MADYRDTLLLPFDKDMLSLPTSGAHWAMFNARPLPSGLEEWREFLICEQGFRPDYLALERIDYQVVPTLVDQSDFEGTLVLAARSRQVNEANIARAWNNTKQGGVIVVAGDKNSGVQPLRKWAGKRCVISGSLSKHHAIVFWLVKDGDDWLVDLKQVEKSEYHVAPGMFSASGPDKGSQLLVPHFDDRIRGRVADFGAGWGYLSAELLKRSTAVESLDLFEADWASLQAAKVNVGEQATYHWADLTSEAPKGPFQWIIMNPPFHTGRASEPDLGKKLVEAAARALPGGGRLLMVANRNLPYEQTIRSLFKKMEMRADSGGFKIIEAVKGG